MMCQLFKAATTYDENTHACKHGITVQVTQTLYLVDKCFINEYSSHQEQQRHELNQHNIQSLVKGVVESLIGNKEVDFSRELSEFSMIGKNSKMPISVIKAINQAFLQHAAPEYLKAHAIPNVEDYATLIYAIRNNKSLVEYVSTICMEISEKEDYTLDIAETYRKNDPFSEKMKAIKEKQEIVKILEEIVYAAEKSIAESIEVAGNLQLSEVME